MLGPIWVAHSRTFWKALAESLRTACASARAIKPIAARRINRSLIMSMPPLVFRHRVSRFENAAIFGLTSIASRRRRRREATK